MNLSKYFLLGLFALNHWCYASAESYNDDPLANYNNFSSGIVEEVDDEDISPQVIILKNEPSKMKFKLGFEFQESSSLYPWALNNNSVQKKSIFSFHLNERAKELWHVEIDTNDIEFVTSPFLNTEQDDLEQST